MVLSVGFSMAPEDGSAIPNIFKAEFFRYRVRTSKVKTTASKDSS